MTRVHWILMIAVFVAVLTLILRVCVRKFLLAKSVITNATYCSNWAKDAPWGNNCCKVSCRVSSKSNRMMGFSVPPMAIDKRKEKE